jgi:prepilin-type N-terminal cleavage/methylation domain-containing protein
MRQRCKGFTLIEVIVILAVISILAAMAIPTALRIFQTTAENTTKGEMANLKYALLGDPTKIQNGVRSDFGFLGDIGCLPTAAFPSAPELDRLLTQGNYPFPWAFNSTAQIGAGWNGPYITGAATGQGTAEFENDQWGNAYTYTVSGTCPLTATFKSAGPDGIAGNSDDIEFSIVSTDTTSTVTGYLKNLNGNPVGSSTVTINYPVNGTLTTANQTTNASGFYQFTNVPFGKRSITFPSTSPKLIVTSARAITATSSTSPTNTTVCGAGPPTSCPYVEITLANYSTTAVTNITTVAATYSATCVASPGPWYYRINWGATAGVFSSTTTGRGGNGAAGAITASSVGAASTGLSPFVFIVDGPQEVLPDTVVGKSGQVGTSVQVQIANFRTVSNSSTGGSPCSMAGVPFIVTFSDGSTVNFTPQ